MISVSQFSSGFTRDEQHRLGDLGGFSPICEYQPCRVCVVQIVHSAECAQCTLGGSNPICEYQPRFLPLIFFNAQTMPLMRQTKYGLVVDLKSQRWFSTDLKGFNGLDRRFWTAWRTVGGGF